MFLILFPERNCLTDPQPGANETPKTPVPATPQQQNQGNPKPENKPNEQQSQRTRIEGPA